VWSLEGSAYPDWLLLLRIALAIKGFSEISYESERPGSTI
jgi:hypothetical protein